MTWSRGMQTLITDGAFIAHEAQLQLVDRFEHHHWAVDLDAGEFRFEGPDTVTFPVQLLGTSAPGPRSWLWGWANPGGFRPEVLAAAEAARAFGGRYDVPELVEAEVPFPPGAEDDDRGAGYEQAWGLSIAARLASGAYFGYSGPIGGGSRAWMLLGGIAFEPPTAMRATRVLSETLQTITVTDHRRAVASWASLRGVPFEGRELTFPDGTVTVDFDDLGRLSDVRGSLRGA